MFLQQVETGAYYIVLRAHKWATLCWPVSWEAGPSCFQLDASAMAEWVFVFNTEMWSVLSCELVWQWGFGVCLQRGPAEPLLKGSLRTPKRFTLPCRLSSFA